MFEAWVTPSSLLVAGDCLPTNSTTLIFISILSLLGCLYVIGTYLYVPALRQHPAGIMFGMSVYCAIYQCIFLIEQSSFEIIECSKMEGILVDFFLTGQETYMFLFAIDLLLALKNPFSTSKNQMIKYHIYTGLWSFVFAFFSHIDTHFDTLFGFCWMKRNTFHQPPMIRGSMHSSIINTRNVRGVSTGSIIFALYIVVVYCTSLCAILKTWNTFLKGLRDTFKTRQRIHRHLKYYVGCYFGYWTLVLASYALFSILPTKQQQHFTTITNDATNSSSMRCNIWHFLSCLILSKGMVNAIIWTRTSNILKIIQQLHEFGSVDLPPQEESINWALRLEILTNTTKGICESIDRAERQARSTFNPSFYPSSMGNRNSSRNSGSSSSSWNSSRYSSFCSMNSPPNPNTAAMVMNEIHGNGRRGGGEQEEDGTDLTMNHTTIRNFGRNINMNNRNEFYGRDLNLYTQIEEIILENQNDLHLRNGNNGNNGNNGTIRSENVAFFDYAPHIFRRLRMQAKISCANYRHSFRQTTKERVSEGKSGAFFYFTQDRKYVVKTLTQEELKFLLTILPKYDTFLHNNPNTFVTRFFGCHAIRMYGKTMFFMVMQSVFDTNLQIHERFDLKGSWVGRLEGRKPTGTKAKCKFCNKKYIVGGSHNQICEVRGGDGNLRHQYDQVGKDLNWNHHMALPKESAKKVAKQLFLDSNFLSKMNCIDYSLLVGVHHRRFNVSHYSSADNFDIYGDRVSRTGGIPVSTHGSTRGSTVSGSTSRMSGRSVRNTDENHPSSSSPEVSARESINNSHIPGIHQVTSKPFHQATLGGMSVDEVHGPGIYFMGLIDILQQWNFRKRLEHFIRVYLLRQDKKGISVVNPKEYAERFQQRVVRELIYDASSHERAVIYPIRLTTPMAQVPVFIPPHNTQIQEPIQSAIALDNEDSSSFAATTRMNMEALLPISVNNTLPRRRPRSTASWGNRRSSNASPIPIRLSSVSPRPSALFPTTTYRCSRNSFDMVYPSYVDYCLPPVYSNLSPSSSAKSNTACDTRNSMISIGRTSEEEEEEEEMIEYDKSQSQGSRMGLGLSSASASPSPCSTRDFIGLSLDEKEEEEEEEVFSSSSSSSSSSSNVPVQDDDGNDYRIVHSPIYPEKSIQPTRSA